VGVSSIEYRPGGRAAIPNSELRIPNLASCARYNVLPDMADYSHCNPLVAPDAVASWLGAVPKPIAVTGGTGFVGSHLVDTLCAAGVEPRVLVRNPDNPRWIGEAPVAWCEGSLGDSDALKRLVHGAGTVIHLAGVVRAGRSVDFDRGNRLGTSNLVAAMAEAAPSARLVHVSSLAAAGPSPQPEGVGPEVEPAPISWYGQSKHAAEIEARALPGGGWWTIVRPPAVYGPRDTDVFEFFRMASRGLIALPGGERWLSVVWVGDVVRSILAAAAGDPFQVYHIGEPEPVLLDELLAELCRAGGVTARRVTIPPKLVRAVGAVGSALQRIGWRRLALTGDKTREILARHWTARTAESMHALGIRRVTLFADGAATTWIWYRERGWLN
jgi:nucleoside-diphosphate-sugar epimerase